MKYGLPLFLLAVLAAPLALPQSASNQAVPAKTKSQTSNKKTLTKSTAAKSTAARPTATKKARSAKKPVVAARPARQLTPTPDRYREIQQALVEKGYLKSEPSGVWDTESADALRQFQTDKNLAPTGKLSSASLIALGLGPKTASAPPDAAGTTRGEPGAPVEPPPAAARIPNADPPPSR